MGVKKQKQLRRHIRFYKTCFGFREPFKVICDGTFLHYNLSKKLGSPQDILPSFLGAAAKAFVTRCVVSELKKMGEAYSGTASAARRFELAKCEHEQPWPAADCVAAMVGSHNDEHFFVATQDVELRKKLRQVHGGALIYAKHTWLVLEPPSDKQQEYARLSENERLHVTQRERFLLEAREGKLKPQNAGGEQNADGIIRDPSSAQSISLKDSAHHKTPRGVLTTKDRPTFKRKRAKAPNPLSCLKKKKKVVNPASTEEKEGQKEDGTLMKKARARQRVRKRHRSATVSSVNEGEVKDS
ncbi:unnamed protein product [Sphagnum troendelagicum]|uniref:UTP23 sensor motif region domain-containing protein n=1 Tax=Sphagnum troendelagicum TaxID=128251 RepID=A0ABP0TYL6_9BRYO